MNDFRLAALCCENQSVSALDDRVRLGPALDGGAAELQVTVLDRGEELQGRRVSEGRHTVS